MPKRIQYDDANSYFTMLLFLGLGLVPATWITLRKLICKGGLFVPAARHGGSMIPGSVRSASLRRRRNVVEIVKLLALVLLWVVFVWLSTQVADSIGVVFDPWAILELEPGSTAREIKRRYRSLSMTHHPDKGGNEADFIRISSAYVLLSECVRE